MKSGELGEFQEAPKAEAKSTRKVRDPVSVKRKNVVRVEVQTVNKEQMGLDH
jgi:hypothetical protein